MIHNPFSTRKTNPGKIPYYSENGGFSCGKQDHLIFCDFYSEFRKSEFQSQITGNHGSGKTTFLLTFLPFLEKQGHLTNHFTLHDGQRTFTNEFWERLTSLVYHCKYEMVEKPPIAVVDGYEQLSFAQKTKLRLFCRKGKCGLLITTHTTAWRLPVLLRTEPTLKTLQYVLGHLLRDQPDFEPPDDTLCQSLFDHYQGNIRNVLFALYDHYEETAKCRLQSNS